jgi:hypothetical protein
MPATTQNTMRSEALERAVSIVVALNHTQPWFPGRDSLAIVELADQFYRFLNGTIEFPAPTPPADGE